MFAAKKVLIKQVKKSMIAKRFISQIQLHRFVEQLKVYIEFCKEKKKLMQASLYLAIKLYSFLKIDHKRLGPTETIRNQKRYYHFRLPLYS